LGGSAHVEGCTKNYRLTHISGFRYKTSQYMLKSLDTKGEYNPSFIDFQTYLTYDLTTDFELSFLGNIAQNKYDFIPLSLESAFGTIGEPLNLKIYFDGKETDRFTTLTGALAGTYHPSDNKWYKFIASAYNASEEETYDIQGQYFINELDKDLGSESMGDSLMNIGIGTFLNHARNYLDATVVNLTHKGFIANDVGNNLVQWGARLQREYINDNINEWQMLDSSGYSLPYSDTAVNLYYTLNATNNLTTNRIETYIQDSYTLELDSNKIHFTGGIRGCGYNFNDTFSSDSLNSTPVRFFLGPRVNIGFRPNWRRNIIFRFSAGYYYQPPFYKEIRNLNGDINLDIKPQKSIHFVLGTDFYFNMWGRPFKYVAEVYYKKMDNLIPYIIDQVRIRYMAENNAHGFATGIDMKINGEFVKGVDSWASLSVMRTMEDIENDVYTDSLGNPVYPGYVPRPSDQMVNFGLFFQDYIPKHPSYKVHLSLMFGSGLPFGPPKNLRYRTALRMPPYRRVDIGFSKEIVSELAKLSRKNPLRSFKSIWICLEVFNLLDINNTISYLWITDIYGRQLAVPNYLTSRRLNVKLIVKI
ncbi:MAG: TonB-dependent receptor, partial [Bacteroidetes bacterium]|nr:TonB-dependent receptor [Bacteroidota bacterium]